MVCPCSSWSLQQSLSSPSVQPCPASWEALDVDVGGVSFPGPAPLTQHCHDAALARHTRLSHRSPSRRRRGEAACVFLHAQSLTWCLRAAPCAGGQGNGFLIYRAIVSCVRVARDVTEWKPMVAMHCTWCCFGFCTGVARQRFYLWFWCQWKWQWLTSVCAGLTIWHHQFILHFFTPGSLFCVLLRGSSEEHKWKQKHNSKKKISLYDRIQIKVVVKCFSAIHTWNCFFCALSLSIIPCSELQCVFIIGKLWKDLSL